MKEANDMYYPPTLSELNIAWLTHRRSCHYCHNVNLDEPSTFNRTCLQGARIAKDYLAAVTQSSTRACGLEPMDTK